MFDIYAQITNRDLHVKDDTGLASATAPPPCDFFHKLVKLRAVAQKPSSGSPSTYAGFGIQFVVAILLFAYAGSWVDRYLGSRPLFLVIGVFVGAGGTFYGMYRRVMRDAGTGTDKRNGR